ncbi:transglycosylase SLT domain-containing protein [Pontibacter sp. G13]|uniref:transglycosylase SLT domain-containing protein n=1 Tax=Pontibacter sp. G13 TaxID=3074898 RepID=UPI00288A1133|nr:transglycosylase SLT domain-containing protein [Pontibacter sp. G13]WNJ16100.1 transglycosylase SLT domain-containing protein [Pontibacter sp. G13]
MGKRVTSAPVRRYAPYVTLTLPRWLFGRFRLFGVGVLLVLGTNLYSHWAFNPSWSSYESGAIASEETEERPLYLRDKAGVHISDLMGFEEKVREISAMLGVPASWLMAVMYAESRFDPGIANHQGSGAIGLIQFMPETARSLQVSPERLKRMDGIQQLEYVYLYLQRNRERYGDYLSLTDLYLSILYPKALGQEPCYTMYANPTRAYRQNRGLDENQDGRVTVSDIDRFLKRRFPEAYRTERP